MSESDLFSLSKNNCPIKNPRPDPNTKPRRENAIKAQHATLAFNFSLFILDSLHHSKNQAYSTLFKLHI